MGTPWDRAATRYIEEWVPRFVPYHLDLVRELAIAEGQRVLVAAAGPGAEVLAVARAIGERGHVLATDPSDEMVRICQEQAKRAGFSAVACQKALPEEAGDGAWDAIVCAFGIWPLANRVDVLRSWASKLESSGKVGVLTFGPAGGVDDPFALLSKALSELEPSASPPPRGDPARESMAAVFEQAGLELVRHTVLRHTVSFPSAEAFVDAIREGRTWRRVWEELGPERGGRVAARFFAEVGGPTAPLSFEPAVTLAIAALPGAEVELAVRKSVVVPPPRSRP